MKKFNMTTPEGTKDILFEECLLRRDIEKKIRKVFLKNSYNEVISPGIEFYDVFDAIPQFEMYKSMDNNGRLLAFRPDLTLPIARLTATRLKNIKSPVRLFYNQAIYRNRPEHTGRSDEVTQAGIELMGATGLLADLEVITMAAKSLSACGLDFRIEIGHAKLFKLLIDKLDVSENVKEEICINLQSKNFANISDIVKTLPKSVYTDILSDLPSLFGADEVLEKAASFCVDEQSAKILKYLKKLYKALSDLGLKDKIMFDLTMVQKNDYYTGAVFTAFVEGHRIAVLDGGRYDNLLSKFGEDMPAVGFAINIDALVGILLNNQKLQSPDVLIHCDKGYEVNSLIQAENCTNDNLVCEMSFCKDLDSARSYAKDKGIKKLIYVSSTITEERVK